MSTTEKPCPLGRNQNYKSRINRYCGRYQREQCSAVSELGEGTVVKCSYCPVALGPHLKSQYDSQMVCYSIMSGII